LTDNYERAEGVCLPRCVLYTHYLDFCKKMKYTPAGAATFGKGSNRKYSLSAKTGTLLPEFPNADNLILPENVQRDKMETFIMMYRTHCQRILDTVISANFEEVLVDVLIPSTIQDLPESLGTEIKLFIRKLPFWVDNSLDNISQEIRKKKMEVIKTFVHSVRRQLSFVHLAQTSRSVLLNHEILNQMIEDIAEVDFSELTYQASYMTPSGLNTYKECIFDFFEEFQTLLTKQAPIEAYTEWLDNIIDKCILQGSKDKTVSFKEKASRFLLQWETFCSLFMRDLTLQGATSFGSFHLLRIMCDEYIFLVLETQQDHQKEQILQKNVQKYMKNAEEIKMHAKIRTHSSKHLISPKAKKRKFVDESFESNDEADTSKDENRPTVPDGYTTMNGTAFTRPQPSSYREHYGLQLPDEACRPSFSHAPLPLSPLKHYPSINGSGFDRPTYFPQYGLNTYSDLMSASNTLSNQRAVQNYSDAHVQTLQSVPFSSSVPHVQSAGSYWADSRPPPPLHDPYSPYPYNKFHSTYDSYNKNSFLRSGSYQDAINRSAFDTSRPYYRSHDNFQVGNHLPMGGFTSNFMDIAQQPSQYSRQDSMFYQDELYPGNVPSSFSTFGKSYLATPFR
ncbi:hypothetical protein FSP39_010766, partial [Pinctada imbricata]